MSSIRQLTWFSGIILLVGAVGASGCSNSGETLDGDPGSTVDGGIDGSAGASGGSAGASGGSAGASGGSAGASGGSAGASGGSAGASGGSAGASGGSAGASGGSAGASGGSAGASGGSAGASGGSAGASGGSAGASGGSAGASGGSAGAAGASGGAAGAPSCTTCRNDSVTVHGDCIPQATVCEMVSSGSCKTIVECTWKCVDSGKEPTADKCFQTCLPIALPPADQGEKAARELLSCQFCKSCKTACNTPSTWTCSTPGSSEANCWNSQDDDSDGSTDCKDSDCNKLQCDYEDYTKKCSSGKCISGIILKPDEKQCANKKDDDSDNLIDCEDPDCSGKPCNLIGGVCVKGSCVDALNTEFNCWNAKDDDGDFKTDCLDSDCKNKQCSYDHANYVCSGTLCIPGSTPQKHEQNCADKKDNDGDRLTDCEDPDCRMKLCGPLNAVCVKGVCK